MKQAFLVLFLSLAAATAFAAEPKAGVTVRVEVVESAGNVAYVKPGERAGLRAGQTVKIGGATYKVTSVTAETAAIDLAGAALAPGASGEAAVARSRADRPSRATRPLPLSAFQGAWSTPVLPAARQRPTPLPLSARSARSTGPWSATFQARAANLLPAGEEGATYRQELAARGEARLAKEYELWMDADGALQAWNGPGVIPRPEKGSPPPARVRELRARWGAPADPTFAGGRLRRAAWSLGEIDGVRVRAPLGPISIAAFGGFLPDPIDHAPTDEATRAGIEASWNGGVGAWRPALTLAAHASWFEGELDERRVTGTASLVSRYGSFFGWTEISQFDSDNPWNAEPVELSGAGGDGRVRLGILRAGARIQTHYPERSLRMQAYLPQSWLCTAERQSPGTLEPCASKPLSRTFAGADVGIELHYLAMSGGATATFGPGLDEILGFADLRTLSLAHGVRVETGAFSTRGELADRTGGRLGVGALLFQERVDVFVAYEPQQLEYHAFPDEPWIEHRVSTQLLVRIRPDAEMGVLAERAGGEDAPRTFVLGTLTWRPQPGRRFR